MNAARSNGAISSSPPHFCRDLVISSPAVCKLIIGEVRQRGFMGNFLVRHLYNHLQSCPCFSFTALCINTNKETQTLFYFPAVFGPSVGDLRFISTAITLLPSQRELRRRDKIPFLCLAVNEVTLCQRFFFDYSNKNGSIGIGVRPLSFSHPPLKQDAHQRTFWR